MLSRSPRMSMRKTTATPMPAASTPAMNPNRNLAERRRALAALAATGFSAWGAASANAPDRFLEVWKLRFLARLEPARGSS